MKPQTFQLFLKFLVILVLPLHFLGCASFGPTQPNLPYAGNSYPAVLNDLALTNPMLVEELGKLPELQDGVSETELSALINIVELHKSDLANFETALNEMYKVGLPEHRKYCSPLQAIFWLMEDGKRKTAQEIIKSYNLDYLLKKAWFNQTPTGVLNLTREEIIIIAQNHVNDTYLPGPRTSIKQTYDRAIDTLNTLENNGEREDYLNTISKKIYMDYIIDKNRFDNKGRSIIQKAIRETSKSPSDIRWKKYDVVMDRLNSPELVDYYLDCNITYIKTAARGAYMTFKSRKGQCTDAAYFAVAMLKPAGYKTFMRSVRWGLSDWNDVHTGSGVILNDNQYLIVADFGGFNGLSGPYDDILSVDNKLANGKKIIHRQWGAIFPPR